MYTEFYTIEQAKAAILEKLEQKKLGQKKQEKPGKGGPEWR